MGFDEFFKLVDVAAEEYEKEYKADWLKMKKEKEAERKRQEEELKKYTQDSSEAVIDKKKLIEEVVSGREIADMYLKHPGNESSSDEEGTEAGVIEDDKPEDVAMFQEFIRKHVKPNNKDGKT